MTVFGIDYAWSRPSVATMSENGVQFIARYLSNDPSKNLSRSEAESVNAAGIWCVVVWETTATRPLSGRSGGVADAERAQAQATAVGMPDDRPIYFAVDWDATTTQQPTIDAYMDGVASVVGRDRVGMYGGYGPISRAFDSGKITWGWQTYAWSGGKWDNRAHIQQYKNGVRLGGADVDYNRAMLDDYGQWKVGESPVALSDADKKWLMDNMTKAVLMRDLVPAPDGTDVANNPTWRADNILRGTYTAVQGIKALLLAEDPAEISDADIESIVAGVLSGIDGNRLAEVIADNLGAKVAGEVLDALKARLEN